MALLKSQRWVLTKLPFPNFISSPHVSNNQISPILISEKRLSFAKTVSPFGDFSTPKIKIKIKITTENATLKKEEGNTTN